MRKCETEWRGHTERFLLEGEKDGVDELDVLDIIVDHIVKLESLSPQSVSDRQYRARTATERTGVQAAPSQIA